MPTSYPMRRWLRPGFRDNAGSVVIRSRFLGYTGVLIMHWHMMNHEEMGMMQTVEVYKD
jgi:FtsP/CotA-like multicopper oxidase with cupredoxin domain